jgi:hypothetical protein
MGLGPQHVGQAACIGLVGRMALLGHGLHPVQVGAGAERGAGGVQHDQAQGHVLGSIREGLVQARNHRRVKGIAPRGAVQGQSQHGSFSMASQVGHAVSFR